MKTRYSVGEVASLLGLSPQMIRKYEQLGLLAPSRSENNYRSYESPDITLLLRIRLLRNLGFSLEEIQEILSPGRRINVIQLYETQIEKMQEEIEHLEMMITCTKLHKKYYQEHVANKKEIQIEQTADMRFILYRNKRTIYPQFLHGDLLAKTLSYSPPFQYMIRFPNDREQIKKGEYEVGLVVPAEFSRFVPRYKEEHLLPAQTCVTVLVRHIVEKKDGLWENIPVDREFENSGIYDYLEENNLTVQDDIFGLILISNKIL